MDAIDKIVAAVLYEGYVLWPYRRSAMKNRQRWTFGGVYPPAYSEASGASDPWYMQTQCLVVGEDPIVSVKVRFLQVVDRQVTQKDPTGDLEFVDELHVGKDRYLAWEEAVEREIPILEFRPAMMQTFRRAPIAVAAGSEEEPLEDPAGAVAGYLVRSCEDLEGEVEARSEAVQTDVFMLTVKVSNTAQWDGPDRESALRHAFISTHTILHVENGAFVSLMDPPPELAQAVKACQNIKTWPVLVGEHGDRRAMLSSPIILYDYPQVAPESPGDLFDGTEIDQLLFLNILSLTEEEKEEMRASDPRAREILERSESLTSQDFMNLHGAIREFRMLGSEESGNPLFESLERPRLQSVMVDGIEIGKGSRVRLHPRPGGDIMDIALAGKAAIIEAIEQDYEDRIYLAVTLEDDPGRALGEAGQIGHRFFFSPEEVEPLREGAWRKV